MCRVHIKQFATNWISAVEIFSPSGASVSQSWTDPQYKKGIRANEQVILSMPGYPHKLVVSELDFPHGKWQ
jgi:hypothetical protein